MTAIELMAAVPILVDISTSFAGVAVPELETNNLRASNANRDFTGVLYLGARPPNKELLQPRKS
jgi:hypothetical protein